MSHFNVLAIVPPGKSIEDHLQPFHEFECTGHVDQFVIDVDKTADVIAQAEAAKEENPDLTDAQALAQGLDYYGLADKQITGEGEVDRSGDHMFGFAIMKDGELVKAVKRTNPNRKWDYWVVGGRWQGMLLLKDGRQADQAVASEVDWGAMVSVAAEEAGGLWDEVTSAVAGRSFRPWAQFVEQVEAKSITIEQAREQYNEQGVVADTKGLFGWFDGAAQLVEITSMSREDYAEFKGKESACTYALLDADGNWIAPGEMGWFGMSSDTLESRREFANKFWEYTHAVPADFTVAVVDCHI